MALVIVIAAVLGFLASFISALFGGGSGLIFVPGILWLLVHTQPQSLLQYAMQTSLATGFFLSIFIGFVSSKKQARYGNIDKAALFQYGPGVLGGTLIGTVIILFVDTHLLKIYFSIVVLSVAIWMYQRHRKEKSQTLSFEPIKIRSGTIRFIVSALVGLLSATTGVAIFTVPFLLKMRLDIRRAIATSTVMIFLASILSAIMLLLIGLPFKGLPQYNIGFINIPIALSALIPTFIGSALGSKLAHVLPKERLSLLFIVMMMVIGLLMLIPH